MAARHCDIALTGCPGVDAPITNISAEAPDPLLFAAVVWPNYDVFRDPPLGDGPYIQTDCAALQTQLFAGIDPVIYANTQLLANLLALGQELGCDWTPPDGDNSTFTNEEQCATVTCPDGSSCTVCVPAGTMTSGPLPPELGAQWILIANEWAQSEAYLLASQELDCIVPDDPPETPGDDPPTPPVGPGINDRPAWMCFGEEYFNRYTVTGRGSAAYTFSVTGGSLPPGTTLTQDGPRTCFVSGTPTAAGVYNYTITAVSTTVPVFTISVTDYLFVMGITNAYTLPNAVVGTPYTEVLAAAGGTAPYTYALDAGSTLPNGLSLASNGAFSNVPTEDGDFTFDVVLTDAHGGECVQTILLTIVDAPMCPDCDDFLWASTLTTTGGPPPTCTPFNTTGAEFDVHVNGSYGLSGRQNADNIATVTYNGPACNLRIEGTMLRFEGDALGDDSHAKLLYRFNIGGFWGAQTTLITEDVFPPPGAISFATGSYQTVVPVPDTLGADIIIEIEARVNNLGLFPKPYDWQMTGKITECQIYVTPNPLPHAPYNEAYDHQLVGTGGTGPYAFSTPSGSFPTGLSMDALGHVTGTATVIGSYTVTIRATDSTGAYCDTEMDIQCVASNVQDIVWTKVHVDTACLFGTLATGVCPNWQIRDHATVGNPCFGSPHVLQWTGSIYNPGAAYNITLKVRYASSGDSTIVPGLYARLLIKFVQAEDLGLLATDTPNPLVATVSLPAGLVSNITVTLVIVATPGPPSNFIQVEDAVVGGISNLTLEPLTHP